ncbi:hypothetical protein Agub_g8576 [Astrephomene gubernaculifera]|uniref:Uncharacterized protein n=1 Tax=Astrephomene gubernaculifera TaxID=47775 RepID=A0AAD3DUM4_9CHLO|nr:hypothetical protein Agub_g8576 [Astrephomene gubernaculifera]
MNLHIAQPRLGCSRHHISGQNCSPAVIPCGFTAVSRRATPTQPARDVVARSSKAMTRDWDELADALPRANPEKRVLQDIDFSDLVRRCESWEALQRLEGDLRERYDRQPYLAVAVLLRTAELVDVETAGEAERRAVARMLNTSLAPFIADEGIYRYRPHTVPSLLSALAVLQYRNPRLNTAIMKLFESGLDGSLARHLCSVAASAALLGVRLDEEAAEKMGARLSYVLKHCTAEDVGNLATALASYSKLPPSLGPAFLSRLAGKSREMLGELSGEQLVDLLGLFVRQGLPLTGAWVASLQSALLAALPGLTRPRSYATLLFSLAKGSLAITEDFLAALLDRLIWPEQPQQQGQQPGSSPTLLSRMRGGDLAVVAAVLSIYGYCPPPEWGAQFVEALEARVGQLDAKQVVTVVDTCTELELPLGGDLLDELLAAAEGALVEAAAEAATAEAAAAAGQQQKEGKQGTSAKKGAAAKKGASAGKGAKTQEGEEVEGAEQQSPQQSPQQPQPQLPPGRVLQLAASLGSVGHRPDGPWLRNLHAALLAMSSRATASELTEVVAVLPHLSYTYPPEGEKTAAVLQAVKARAEALKGLEAPTRGSIQQSLKQLGYTKAADFADSLKPPPPPPPPPAPAAPAASATKSTSRRKTAAATTSAPAPPPPAAAAPVAAAAAPATAPSAPAAAVGASSSGRAAPAPTSAAAAASITGPSAAGAAVSSRPRQSPAAAAAAPASRQQPQAPPPQPPASSSTLVGSTRGRGRAAYDSRAPRDVGGWDDEDERDEVEEDYDEDDRRAPLRGAVTSRALPSGRTAYPASASAFSSAPPSRPSQAPSRAAPSAPSAAAAPGGFVASIRGSRSRSAYSAAAARYQDDDDDFEEEERAVGNRRWDEPEDEVEEEEWERAAPPVRRAPMPPSSAAAGRGTAGPAAPSRAAAGSYSSSSRPPSSSSYVSPSPSASASFQRSQPPAGRGSVQPWQQRQEEEEHGEEDLGFVGSTRTSRRRR